jgi:hypothetical protein
MHIDPEFLNCVGFVGFPTDQGFRAVGTCFVLAVEQENERFSYLVTARHVVRPTKFRKEVYNEDTEIFVRLPTIDGLAHVIKMTRGQWTPHPDRNIDICISEFDALNDDRRDELNLQALLYPGISIDEEAANEWGFGIGSELFITSVFVGHVGESGNIPIVRRASIAAMATTPIRVGSPTRDAYLVETRSLGGTSGAPVFFHLDPYRMAERQAPTRNMNDPSLKTAPYKLIGMLIGSHAGNYLDDFIADDITDDEAASIISAADFSFNAGISIVLPLNLVIEVLYCKEVYIRRLLAIEAIKLQSGFQQT